MSTAASPSPYAGSDLRAHVKAARRIVIKVGSSSLTGPAGGELDERNVIDLIDVVAECRKAGSAVVLVSSGAIAAGIGPLGLQGRPTDLATQQAAASVGQGALIAAYQRACRRYGLTVGQVLLTVDDVTRRSHFTNARRTLERLLDLGIVPVVNENDTVATHEIRFGDNDRIAALVSHLVDAQALVLLTDVDGLYDGPPARPDSARIPLVRSVTELEGVEIGASGSAVGSGGMATKVEAAAIAGSAGVITVVTSLTHARMALRGNDAGTVFAPARTSAPSRKWWIANAATPRGVVLIDDGAAKALIRHRRSLLPAGVVGAEGVFGEGDAVEVRRSDGRVVGRGLSAYSSADIGLIRGRSTQDLVAQLGSDFDREVIHRDDLVVMVSD